MTGLAGFLTGLSLLAGGVPETTGAIEVREALVLNGGGQGRGPRTPITIDPVALAVVRGTFKTPGEGDVVTLPGGREAKWTLVKAGTDGAFQGREFAGGKTFVNVPVESDRVMMLEASGHGGVLVNGEPHAGDPYGYGYVKVPVLLRKGDNTLLFQNGRGRLSVKLVTPRGPGQIDTSDSTLPDLLVGKPSAYWGALVVANATNEPLRGARLVSHLEGGATVATALPTLLPLSVRKVAFRIEGPAPTSEGKRTAVVTLEKTGEGGPTKLDEATVSLDVKAPGRAHKQTFLSKIDGSVQYFGLVPASDGETNAGEKALILSLHGASVEGIGQANVYAPREWAHVVAPTNRRPYGFDWEDWGRLDAIEVLETAQRQLGTNPRKTYLTGHSMGGHGTWHLGVTFPDRWAAIAPSAGWVSMASYAGARPAEGHSSVAELMTRPTLPSDTLRLVRNLEGLGVYVLHGSADDNVPVDQARTMRKELGTFHDDFSYYEKIGAGHWWGNPCCDWPPLMDFLRLHEIPRKEDVTRVDFVTSSPGVSATRHWATIEAQTWAFRTSEVHLTYDPRARKFSGTTENVARLALTLGHVADGDISVSLDGQMIEGVGKGADARPTAWFVREGKDWKVAGRPSTSLKGPHRSGPFKDAFRNRVLFVYGTKGTAEENAWSLARARGDAERFWYQGNGSIDIVPDTEFDPKSDPNRNVVVYGHQESNAAWNALLGDSPVQVTRGMLTIDGKPQKADDLASLFVRPRPGSDTASVGVVTGTGMAGLRLSGRLPYFTSGVEYPDCLVVSSEILAKGSPGVVAAGFFGNDWKVESGEFAWGGTPGESSEAEKK